MCRGCWWGLTAVIRTLEARLRPVLRDVVRKGPRISEQPGRCGQRQGGAVIMSAGRTPRIASASILGSLAGPGAARVPTAGACGAGSVPGAGERSAIRRHFVGSGRAGPVPRRTVPSPADSARVMLRGWKAAGPARVPAWRIPHQRLAALAPRVDRRLSIQCATRIARLQV